MGTLPTKTKTWQYSLNVVYDNTFPDMFYQAVKAFTGFALNPWTCVGSSDATTGGLDGVNRWSTKAKVIRSTAQGIAHSWIVLRHVTGTQLLIDYMSAQDYKANIAFSPRGLYTGGTSTTAPTATDHIDTACSTVDNGDAFGTFGGGHMHFWHSTDGLWTALMVVDNLGTSAVRTAWFMGQPNNFPANWSYPFVASVMQDGTNTGEMASLFCGTGGAGATWASFETSAGAGSRGKAWGIGEVTNNALVWNTYYKRNDISSEFPVFPLSIGSANDSFYGYLGDMPDMHMVPGKVIAATSGCGMGDTFPSTSKDWCAVGQYLMPWDGSTTMALP